MPTNNPPNSNGTLTPAFGLTHEAPPERLVMNKYHLLLVIDRLMKKPKGPALEHVFIPFALFMGSLLSLVPKDFQDYWGMSGATWQAVAFIIVIMSGSATIGLFIWWLVCAIKYPRQTSDQIFDDICDQIAKDRERAIQQNEQTKES